MKAVPPPECGVICQIEQETAAAVTASTHNRTTLAIGSRQYCLLALLPQLDDAYACYPHVPAEEPPTHGAPHFRPLPR